MVVVGFRRLIRSERTRKPRPMRSMSCGAVTDSAIVEVVVWSGYRAVCSSTKTTPFGEVQLLPGCELALVMFLVSSTLDDLLVVLVVFMKKEFHWLAWLDCAVAPAV